MALRVEKLVDASAKALSRCGPFHLQAEVHPSDLPAFASRYREMTGSGPSVFERKQRGTTLAVYFNGTEQDAEGFEKLNYKVKRFFHGQFRFCIEDSGFFWKMVRNGFSI